MIKDWLSSLGVMIRRYMTPAGDLLVAFCRRPCSITPVKKLLQRQCTLSCLQGMKGSTEWAIQIVWCPTSEHQPSSFLTTVLNIAPFGSYYVLS